MCGRFVITSPAEALAESFGFVDRPNVAARYNVAPTQTVPAVRADSDGTRRVAQLRWGLIPSWAKDPFAKGGLAGGALINARSDGVAEKPSFRGAFAERRCLMVADGFYEWQPAPGGAKGRKQPYLVRRADGRPVGFAALWERWSGRDAEGAETTVESCCLITTDAAPSIAHIHHRMPAMLSDAADLSAWLDPETPADAVHALLRPLPDAEIAVHPVSTRVNAVANDDADLLRPIDPAAEAVAPAPKPEPPRQGSLF